MRPGQLLAVVRRRKRCLQTENRSVGIISSTIAAVTHRNERVLQKFLERRARFRKARLYDRFQERI